MQTLTSYFLAFSKERNIRVHGRFDADNAPYKIKTKKDMKKIYLTGFNDAIDAFEIGCDKEIVNARVFIVYPPNDPFEFGNVDYVVTTDKDRAKVLIENKYLQISGYSQSERDATVKQMIEGMQELPLKYEGISL